jgi:hypothetical protein
MGLVEASEGRLNTVLAQLAGDKALWSQEELRRLLELVRRAEEIELRIENDNVPTVRLMRLVEQAGSLDFWTQQGEDIYSIEDGEPL